MGFLNRCIFTAASAGTGDFVVATAVHGYQAPAAAGAVDGAIYSYAAQSTNLNEWEYGIGTYATGTTTLARTQVLGNSLGTTAKINFTQAPQVLISPLSVDLRTQLTADTTYNVATTGSDTTGDGSIGNPWATVQHAINHVMYNVTGRGVTVKISVATGSYDENLLLGPHEIFAPSGDFQTVEIVFNTVTLAPTTGSPTSIAGIVNVANSAWELSGTLAVTQGSSGNDAAFTSYEGGQLRLQANTTFTDNPLIAFDMEFSSAISLGADHAQTITFNSTCGNLVLGDHDCTFDAYQLTDIHFDIDPGFNTSVHGGMYALKDGGGCSITMRNTFSGATPASPSNSVIKFGNSLVVVNEIQTLANYTIANGGRYNNNLSALGVGIVPVSPIHVNSNSASHGQIRLENTIGTAGVYIDYFDTNHSTDWQNGLIGPNFFLFSLTSNIQSLVVSDNGTNTLLCAPGKGIFGWSNDNANAAGITPGLVGSQAVDTGFSKTAPASAALGNGTQGDASGRLNALHMLRTPSAVPPTTTDLPNDGDYAGFFDGTAFRFWVNRSGTIFGGPDITVGYTTVDGGFANALLYVDGASHLVVDPNSVLGYDSSATALRLQVPTVYPISFTIATLPSSPADGQIANISDGDAGLAWGATAVNSGAGATSYGVRYNAAAAAWRVFAK